MPVSLTLQHTAWREGTLIKWASAIEDLIREKFGPREAPKFQNHLAKNVPVDMEYRYAGAPPSFGAPPEERVRAMETKDTSIMEERMQGEEDDGDGCTY